ncbi:TldD/PmbA family protein [Acidianus brierleyi]|uniref:TldD/PmbA family protein n=1 Tax=Acidianus brierleyi TaxID=41673 RepID=A0A2U9IFJ3_9CREN|nr:TldD/PmbA family protein [Acidianus brierleyi]AWR94735.1 TldD/PmbA family protein [Acidianus brierleyi]
MLDNLISKAKSLGFAAEIFYIKRNEFSINSEKQIYSRNLKEEGYGLRIFKDKKVGFAFSTNLNDELLDNAIKSWKISEKDDANEIPQISTVNKLQLFTEFDKKDVCISLFENLNELKTLMNVISIYTEAHESEVGIVNTEGVNISENRSGVTVGIVANNKEGANVSPEIYEYRSFRDPSFNIDEIKEDIKFRINITKNRQKFDKRTDTVILTPKAISELLVPLLSYAITEENNYRGKTPLKENMDIKSGLKIIDDPTIPNSLYSRSFDSEGQQSKTNVIIDGKVKTFLNNWYWSLKAKKQETSSASRSYSTIPSISPSNIKIDFNEKLSADENYVVVDQVQGVHTSNFDTGDFSVVASVAWLSKEEKGIREMILTGNILNLLKGIEAEDHKYKQYNNVLTSNILVKGIYLT